MVGPIFTYGEKKYIDDTGESRGYGIQPPYYVLTYIMKL
jgi:hypothetical protein